MSNKEIFALKENYERLQKENLELKQNEELLSKEKELETATLAAQNLKANQYVKKS